MKVISLNEAANRAGIVRRTLERVIAEGEGPAGVRLSARRVGIIEDDFKSWLASRRRPAPGSVEISGQPGAAPAA
jgi:predicted DNA-binding transcriptional regulator AlpA